MGILLVVVSNEAPVAGINCFRRRPFRNVRARRDQTTVHDTDLILAVVCERIEPTLRRVPDGHGSSILES
jgi:hypothetical protein